MRRRVYVLVTSPVGEPKIFNFDAFHLSANDPDIESVIFVDDTPKVFIIRRINSLIHGMGKYGASAKPVALYRTEDGVEVSQMKDGSIAVEMKMRLICRFDHRNLPVPPTVQLQSQPA